MTRSWTRKDLPVATCEKHVAAFKRAGWTERKSKSSHRILVQDGVEATLSIPCHGDVKRGLLEEQVALAGLTITEYCACFKGKRLEKLRAKEASDDPEASTG